MHCIGGLWPALYCKDKYIINNLRATAKDLLEVITVEQIHAKTTGAAKLQDLTQ